MVIKTKKDISLYLRYQYFKQVIVPVFTSIYDTIMWCLWWKLWITLVQFILLYFVLGNWIFFFCEYFLIWIYYFAELFVLLFLSWSFISHWSIYIKFILYCHVKYLINCKENRSRQNKNKKTCLWLVFAWKLEEVLISGKLLV